VTIQGPQGSHYGGALGGPVFKKVMSFVLQSRHIAPTNAQFTPYPLYGSQVTKMQTAALKKGTN
jgi:cell division protein FtsI (penicillin-binding protein 3)